MKTQAKINGYTCDCENTADSYKWSLVRHTIINRNGAELENMGSDAPSLSIRSHWTGANYENHKRLINEILEFNEVTFEHPAYGFMAVMAEQVTITHDDGIDYCQMEMVLVRMGEPKPLIYSPNIVNTIEVNVVNQYAVQTEKTRLSLVGLVGSAIKNVERAVASMEALADVAVVPANSIVNTISFINTLPGRLVQSAILLAESYAAAINAVNTAPLSMLSSIRTAFDQLISTYRDNAIIYPQVVAVTAAHLALYGAYILASDESNRAANKQRLNTIAFDMHGNLVGSATYTESFNYVTVDQALYLVMDFMQQSLDIDHDNPGLKRMAESLVRYARVIKLGLDRIIVINISSPMPVHALCRVYGLSYTYADDICAINQIRDPNKVLGSVMVYAR